MQSLFHVFASTRLANYTDNYLNSSWYNFPYGLAVRIPGFHPGGPGSTPGMGTTIYSSYPSSPVCVFVDLFLFILFVLCRHCHLIECVCKRMLYTVQVSTLVHYFGGFSSVKHFGRPYVMPLWSLTYKAFWCVVLLTLTVCSTKICIWTRPMGSSPIRGTS